MKRAVTLAAASVLFAGATYAAGQGPATNALAGTWSVSVVNRTEPVRLELTTDGSNLKGVFDGSAIVGEFKNGQLTFGSAARSSLKNRAGRAVSRPLRDSVGC